MRDYLKNAHWEFKSYQSADERLLPKLDKIVNRKIEKVENERKQLPFYNPLHSSSSLTT